MSEEFVSRNEFNNLKNEVQEIKIEMNENKDILQAISRKHDERIEKLEDTYSTLQKMDYRIGKLETTIEKMDNKLDSKINQDSENKGKKWDKLLDYLFYSVIAILLALLYSKLGLKP